MTHDECVFRIEVLLADALRTLFEAERGDGDRFDFGEAFGRAAALSRVHGYLTQVEFDK